MADRTPLSPADLAAALENLPGWEHEDDCLMKTFEFGSFREAVGFIVRLAFDAESLDHHPEISNVYNRVAIALTTHDADFKVTALDVELASRIESVSWA